MNINNAEVLWGECDKCGEVCDVFFDHDEDVDENGCVYPNLHLCLKCCTEMAQMFARSATYYCKAIDMIKDYEQQAWESLNPPYIEGD